MSDFTYRNLSQALIAWALGIRDDDFDGFLRLGTVFARLENNLNRFPSSDEVAREM